MSTKTGPRFFVPPPPEEEPNFDSFQFQSQFSTQRIVAPSIHSSKGLGWSTGEEYPTFQYEEEDLSSNVQKVPGTPVHGQQQWREKIHQIPDTEDLHLRYSYKVPNTAGEEQVDVQLKSVMEIPEQYRHIFSFPYFNIMQSRVFDKVVYTDLPLVVSAPTGSGKTVVFELAILRLMIQLKESLSSVKIVYVAPIKALCGERCEAWKEMFHPLGLECTELTGDTQVDDFFELQKANIITTTPEKWDSMTRRWRDNKSLIQLVRLFLIDEVHQLNDPQRGPTVEAIVSRMKTVQSSMLARDDCQQDTTSPIRFLAVSATIPNIGDIAAWLGSEENPALEYSIDESHRPVHLRKVVLGYQESSSMFKFDCFLNYRLSGVIHTYSEDKPTLVFCATRKGTQQAAATLLKDARFVINVQHKQRLLQAANSLRDSKLRDVVMYGIGYHHAGLDAADRKTMETMFIAGELPVLFCTSTLAMGVNLPAHLVVIKSTMQYVNSGFSEYSESQILQMIGRAGRPQFDTTATAVIMTRYSTKEKYESLMNGRQLIESSLHTNLIEHLNAEVVLGTITDVSIALEWMKSTFLFIRIKQNPKHYGIPDKLSPSQLEEKLQEMCLRDLNLLEAHGLITMEDGFDVKPTTKGRLMAQYCVAFESTKKFLNVKGTESLSEMLSVLVSCAEFEDVRLRVNEKRTLNTLNCDKNRQTIRFPMNGKIKTTEMKVNCLIQAALGSLPLQDFSLNQDTQKVFRVATRLSKCLMELQYQEDHARSLVGAILLNKCVKAKLWENTKHVAKQLDKIGVTLSTALVNAGMTTFQSISAANPRELELILNKHPPFGNQLKDAVSKLPCYSMSVAQADTKELRKSQAQLSVTVHLTNYQQLKQSNVHFKANQGVILVVGDGSNKAVFKQRIMDMALLSSEGRVVRSLAINRSHRSDELELRLIHTDYVGLDCQQKFTPAYCVAPAMYRGHQHPIGGQSVGDHPCNAENLDDFTIGFEEYMDEDDADTTHTTPAPSHSVKQVTQPRKSTLRPCNHRCTNKQVCGHECCKTGGIAVGGKKKKLVPTDNRKHQQDGAMDSYLTQLHAKTRDIPQTPSIKRLKVSSSPSLCTLSPSSTTHSPSLSTFTPLVKRFSYKRDEKPKYTSVASSASLTTPTPLSTAVPPHKPKRSFASSEPDYIDVDELFDDFDSGDDSLVPDMNWKAGLSPGDSGLSVSSSVASFTPNITTGRNIKNPVMTPSFKCGNQFRNSATAGSLSTFFDDATRTTTTPSSTKTASRTSSKDLSFFVSSTIPKTQSLQPRRLVPIFKTWQITEASSMDPTTGQPKIDHESDPGSEKEDTLHHSLSTNCKGRLSQATANNSKMSNPHFSDNFTSFFTTDLTTNLNPDLGLCESNSADLFDGIL